MGTRSTFDNRNILQMENLNQRELTTNGPLLTHWRKAAKKKVPSALVHFQEHPSAFKVA